MQKQLFLIDYECAHWCGGESHCVVWAYNPDDAIVEASDFMEETMRELFSDEFNDHWDPETETGDYDLESAVAVNSVSIMNPENEHWEYFNDPTQQEFYPVIGSPDDFPSQF